MSKLDKILIIDGIRGCEWWLSLFFLFKFLERIVKMTFAIVSKSYALEIVLINSYFLNYQSCSASPLIYHQCFSNLFSNRKKYSSFFSYPPFSWLHHAIDYRQYLFLSSPAWQDFSNNKKWQ